MEGQKLKLNIKKGKLEDKLTMQQMLPKLNAKHRVNHRKINRLNLKIREVEASIQDLDDEIQATKNVIEEFNNKKP